MNVSNPGVDLAPRKAPSRLLVMSLCGWLMWSNTTSIQADAAQVQETQVQETQAQETQTDAAQGQEAQVREATATDDQQSTAEQASAADAADPVAALQPLVLDPEWLKDVPWRSLGPANMSGRVTAVEVHAQDPSLWWIATASGGLLKTSNRGTTVEHQFDREATVSVGAIASDPRNPRVLWVGTGEINPRNSVSYGNGIYRSNDGGRSFQHMGLDQTYQIARILVHPHDSNTVYVGAAGRLYGTNSERGVYKTVDGGQTWEQILYLDDRTGVIDMIMHPQDPDTLIVAMWDRLRDGFDSWPGAVAKPDGIDGYDPIRKWGPRAGLYKTTDGGKNWKRLSQGLPTGMLGRVGLDWQLNSPHTIYAVIDCEDIGKGPDPSDAYLGLVGSDLSDYATVTQIMPGSPAEGVGFQVGDRLRSIDGGAVFQFDELLPILRKKIPGERIRIMVQRGEESIELAPKLDVRPGVQGGPAQADPGFKGETQADRVVVTEVMADGPADRTGLRAGDILTAVDEQPLTDFGRWSNSIRRLAIGDTLVLSVRRGEEDLRIPVSLGRRPGTGPSTTPIMGIQGRDSEGGGAVLTAITAGGPAQAAGLEVDDVVISIEGRSIDNYQSLLDEIRSRRPEDEVAVVIRRGDKMVNATLTLSRTAPSPGGRPYTFSYFGQQANIQDQQGGKGYLYGGVYKSTDLGETWQRVNSLNVRPMYFSVVRVDPTDDQRVYLLGVSQYRSTNGGTTFTSDFGRGVHADCHDLWINPTDGRHMVIGSDGGFYVTYDRGTTWDHVNTAALGQFYHVAIAPTAPYQVYGGLQDNGSWGGPAISRSGGTVIQDWISVGGGDGFVCRVDPQDPDLIYSESQNGAIRRRHLRTGETASIRPASVRGLSYRFNWNTPFILSHHNSKVFYSAGNYVFRSMDRGNDLKRISPEITRTNRGSATALAESPLDSDLLYVGTDDGALWRTKDGGQKWEDITANLGVPAYWVATIEPSRAVAGRVYVCLDAHRSDDDRPYLFVSEDYGDTFRSLSDSLPRGSSRCLREDVINPNLLYLGTEFAFWISLDRGLNWTAFNQKLPTVAVHEVAMHPALSEIVLATHGRSLWACDVTALRGLTAESLAGTAALLPMADVIRWRSEPARGRTNRQWVSQNPESGARLWYHLAQPAEKVVLKIEDIAGKTVAEVAGPRTPGLQSVRWNLTQAVRRRTAANTAGRNDTQPASPGEYRVTLLVDDEARGSEVLAIRRDPTWEVPGSSREESTLAFDESDREQDRGTEVEADVELEWESDSADSQDKQESLGETPNSVSHSAIPPGTWSRDRLAAVC